MTGYSLKTLLEEAGYFHLWLAATKRNTFFAGDDERLFFLGQMQRLLTPGQGSRNRFPIELLAYSLTTDGAHLLIHTSRKALLEHFSHTLIRRYSDYLARRESSNFSPLLIIDPLAGAYEALNVSREIHLLHEDWSHDRFSSIEFYLGRKQTAWLRPGRLFELFRHSPENYRKLVESRPTESDRIFDFIET